MGKNHLNVMIWTAGLGLTLGCTSRQSPPPETGHMFEHFSRVGRIQTAVIEGDLNGTRTPARWIADHEPLNNLPAGSEEFQRRMRVEAATIAGSDDLDVIAAATARIAGTCGACHQAYGGPTFNIGSRPPNEVGVDRSTRMIRHLWAADRMWEGLIGPSEGAWAAGSEVLSDDPMLPTDITHAEDRMESVRRLATQVNSLGAQALQATSPEARELIYGAVLASCTSCHELAGNR